MEMDLDFDSETPPSSPVIGYSAPVSIANFNTDEYCFECKGPIRPSDPTFHPSSLLSSGELISSLKILNKSPFETHPSESSELINCYKFFNFPFSPPAFKIFIQICRKNIYTLENSAKPSSFEFEPEDNSSSEVKPWHLRKDVCNFLNFALKYSSEIFLNANSMEAFHGLRRSLLKIEAWPVSLKNHGGFDDGNKCTSSSYHFFHLQFELRWFFLILSGGSSEVLSWILDDIIYLAWFKFSSEKMNERGLKITSKVPFNCYCVKEFWTMLKHLVDDIKPQGKEFWDYLTSALNRFDTKAKNDLLFPLWLTTHLASLGNYDLKGQLNSSFSDQAKDSYFFVKEVVKSCLNSNAHLPEVLELLCKLLPFWGANDGIAQVLWSFYAGRIDKNVGVQDNSYWKSPEKWLCLIKSLAGEGKDDGTSLGSSNVETDDFFQFIRLFSGHVRFYSKEKKMKLNNMIYLKLPDSKLVNLQEIGFIRLSSLHLAIIAACKDEDTINISKTFLNSYANLYTNLAKKSKHTILRSILTAQATMYLILLEKSINISTLTEPFMSQVSSLMLRESSKVQIDPQKRELVMIYLELLDSIPKSAATTKSLSQESLFSDHFPIWLSSASPDYLNRTLRILHSLLQWQIESSSCPPLVQKIYSSTSDFVKASAYKKNTGEIDLEPLADLAADLTFLMKDAKSIAENFFDTFALEVRVHPELSCLYVEKVSGFGEAVIKDNLKLLQAWVRLICTGVRVPRKLTGEVLEENGELLFGYSNDSLLELFCGQASENQYWERKDIEEILKCLVDLCKNNWVPLKDNLGMVQATINSSKIVLTKLKFTKLYTPKVSCVASFILDFYVKLLNSFSEEVYRIWFKHLPEVFEAVTASYGIWDNDPYLKRQVQAMISGAFLGFSSNEYLQRSNTENHPAVVIMKLALETDNVTVLEDILPNLKLVGTEARPNPAQDYLRTLGIFTRRNINMLAVVVYALPGILRIVRTTGSNSELPVCSELICSVLGPGNGTMSAAVVGMKVKEAFRGELEGNLGLNYRKYFKLFSAMLNLKVGFRGEVRKFLGEELLPLVREQIKLCERMRGTGQNDSVWKCLQMFEVELERSAP